MALRRSHRRLPSTSTTCSLSGLPTTSTEGQASAAFCLPARTCETRPLPAYRLHDTTGDDLGLIEHPAPNVAPGDEVILPDGREALVTARVEAEPGLLAALLQIVIVPSRREADDALP